MRRLNFNTIQIRNFLILGIVLPGAAMAYTFTFGQSDEEKENELKTKFKDEISRKQRVNYQQSKNSANSKKEPTKDIDRMYDFLRKEVTNTDADFVNPILHSGRGNMVRIEKLDEEDIKATQTNDGLSEKKITGLSDSPESTIGVTAESKEEPSKKWYPGKYVKELLQRK